MDEGLSTRPLIWRPRVNCRPAGSRHWSRTRRSAAGAFRLSRRTGRGVRRPRAGRAATLELCLLGTPVTAERALQLGIVNRVVPAAELEKIAGSAMHGGIVRIPGTTAQPRTTGITGLVYRSVRGVTGLVGTGIDALMFTAG